MPVQEMLDRLRQFASKEKARVLRRFFKTGPGEYGYRDQFLGVTVPKIRSVVREFGDARLSEVEQLLKSAWHEERLLALLILVQKFERGEAPLKKKIYSLYLKRTKHINNWDLVDLTAPKIVGPFLQDRPRKTLYRLVRSRNLWERRIAILATFHYIRQRDYADTLALSAVLIEDREVLLHKAVGWMLREVGKRDSAVLEQFLRKYYRKMPRTMLRSAIERFPESKRRKYLKGAVSRRMNTDYHE
jgi:3-methyladenine DNA glycosylase AlkD